MQDAFARIDQDDGHVGGGGPGSHVPRVLLMPGRVGNDKFAMWSGEIAVGDINGDSLFPLRAQPVGEQGKIDCTGRRFAMAALVTRAHDLRRFCESYSSLPIRVDLPSSTLPAVLKRSRSLACSAARKSSM